MVSLSTALWVQTHEKAALSNRIYQGCVGTALWYCELVQVTLLARSRPTSVSARLALVFPHFENLPWSAQGCLISTWKGSLRESKEIHNSINGKYLMILALT